MEKYETIVKQKNDIANENANAKFKERLYHYRANGLENFRAARMRVDPAYVTEFSKIEKCYKEWLQFPEKPHKKVSPEELREFLIFAFSNPVNGYYMGLIVFSDSESVDEWDKEHQ
jgi:hypothetical protein